MTLAVSTCNSNAFEAYTSLGFKTLKHVHTRVESYIEGMESEDVSYYKMKVQLTELLSHCRSAVEH